MSKRDIIQVEHIPPKHWWNRAKWRLMRPYASADGEIVVPEGYVTDGATIMWALRWRFSSTGRYFGAAIVHDYIVSDMNDWSLANDKFEKEMVALNVSKTDMLIMVSAVKLYAWFKFKVLGGFKRK